MKDLVQNFHFWPPKIEQFSVPKTKKKERKKKKLKWSSSSYMCPVVPFRNKIKNQNFFFLTKTVKNSLGSHPKTQHSKIFRIPQVLPYVQTYPNVTLRKK